MATRESCGSEVGRRNDRMASIADNLVTAVRCGEPSLATGFAGIDRLTGGLRSGDFLLLAGYPGMGKTALATSLAISIGIKQMKPVAFLSLQMAAGALCDRFLSALARVDLRRLRSGPLSRQDKVRLAQASSRCSQSLIRVSDRNLSGLDDLATLVRSGGSRAPLIILDGMQSLIAAGDHALGEVEQLECFSRGLKLMAREMRVPVIATCQLPIDPADPALWQPEPPSPFQLGGLGEDPDLVILLHRQEHQLRRIGQPVPQHLIERAQLIVAKNRSGPAGRCAVIFQSDSLRFEDRS